MRQIEYLYNMNAKEQRLESICEIIRSEKVGNQDELLKKLKAKGFIATQATLSRDIKQLKIAKSHSEDGEYIYSLPEINQAAKKENEETRKHPMIEFSGNLAILKTRSGYAMGVAYDIDQHAPQEILATIAGDDTILVIPREGYSRESVVAALARFID